MKLLPVMLLSFATVPWAMAVNRTAIPLMFVPNSGQAPPAVRYMVKSPGLTAYFAPREVLIRAGGSTLRIRFSGAAHPRLTGESPLDGRANFLTGPPEEWRTGVPTFGAVRYRELYRGIDLRYAGEGPELKSEFHLAPGADPSTIRIQYPDSTVRIDADGALVIPLGGRELREHAPVIYQDSGGRRVTIGGGYTLGDDGSVGFAVGAFDRALPLVIDPVLSYSTLLGGSGFDTATSIAVNVAGEAYVAGFTDSYNFPLVNSAQGFNGGGNDVFVAKLKAAGNGLVYATYIGGQADDRAYSIAVDASGSAYVAGATTSRNFPTRVPVQGKLTGYRNAFVFKLNPAGNGLVYSTYLGGNASDAANGIAVDAAGSAYIVGDTTSFGFPANAMQRSIRGGQDAFAAKLSASGQSLLYCTFLGGSSDDHGAAIALAPGGAAWIAGSTYSTDFPTVNPTQGSNAGGQDAFVARLAPDGNSLEFATYLGGSGGTVAYPETAQAIALDGQGNAYITGTTNSADFPLLAPLQAARLGISDAFVSKIAPYGALAYSTYLGGSGAEVGTAIAVDPSGAALVAGYSYSADLPVTAAVQGTIGGDYDAFVAKVAPTGNSLSYLSYLGGNGSDAATGIALDGTGGIYVTGWTLSTNFPTLNPFQTLNSGNYGAFVTKLASSSAPVNVSVAPASGSGAAQVFTFQVSDSAGAADLSTISVLFNTSASAGAACSVVYQRAQNTLALLTDGGVTPVTAVTPGFGTQQNSQCVLNAAGSSVTLSGNLLTLGLSLTFLGPFSGAKTVYMSSTNPSGATGWQAKGTWTVGFSVATVSVTPASGSGATQVFGMQFSDDAGAADLTSVALLINASPVTSGACSVTYNRAANTLALLTDSGAMPVSTISPGGGTQQNSQCILSGPGSTAVLSGNVLTLNLSITFQGTFSGAKTVYLSAASPSASTGWQSRGSWSVGASVSAVSVAPASGSGASATFSMLFSDTSGATDLTSVSLLINTSAVTSSACSVAYSRAANTLALLTDSGALPGSTIVPGSGSQQNSQCVLNGAGSSVSVSGTALTLNLSITFQAGFAGTRNLYLSATSPFATTGWQARGSWTVSAAAPPPAGVAVSVTPNSGTGASQTFQVVASDALGRSDIQSVWLWFNVNSSSAANNCLISYTPSIGQVGLANDAFSAWSSGIAGQAGTLQNSQCTVNTGGVTATPSGNQVTISVPITFLPAFQGTWQVREYVFATVGSGWQTMGNWSVPAPSGGGGTAVSVTPSTGSGIAQVFQFVASDTYGTADVASIWMWFNNNPNSAANNCLLSYTPSGRQLRLANDAFTDWSVSSVGQAGSLKNSQCSVDPGGASVTVNGTQITVSVPITFSAAFQGDWQVREYVFASVNSGWQTLGSWTVPAPVSPGVTAVSATPASGTGNSQVFQFVASDSAGLADIGSVWMWFNSNINSAVNNCLVSYSPSTRQVRLANDAFSDWTTGTAGQAGTLQNSQCAIDTASFTATLAASQILISMPVTFRPAFRGTWQIRMYIFAGVASGWQTMGTWTVL